MKKLILTALTAALLASPMAASAAGRTVVKERATATVVVHKDDRGRQVQKTVVKKKPVQTRKWQRGQKFDRTQASNYRQIDYRTYKQRGLYTPPKGSQWVQSGNDAVLVAVASGLIGAVIGGALAN
ncbi:RcnB family protein [Sphingomonas sp. CFBP 13720]|uniref:RcnB family protein n=1 Tax=Sphingomonas sp. CFBP 13720 TaxID=2775302 RepID=UPI00177FC93C|nr:RcnB family protein [Sphingomonas sp. CFBP 13720]MBD8677189.1 RcnB family protein [Sphingomonas sp. CFBP 13720]